MNNQILIFQMTNHKIKLIMNLNNKIKIKMMRLKVNNKDKN